MDVLTKSNDVDANWSALKSALHFINQSPPEASLLEAAGRWRKMSGATDTLLMVGSICSFGIAAGAHYAYTARQSHLQQKAFATLAEAMLTFKCPNDSNGLELMELTISYANGDMKIAQGKDSLCVSMNGQTIALTSYKSISAFMDAIAHDIHQFPEAYSKLSDQLRDSLKIPIFSQRSLSDLSSLPQSFVVSTDVILPSEIQGRSFRLGTVPKINCVETSHIPSDDCKKPGDIERSDTSYYAKPVDGEAWEAIAYESGIDDENPQYGLRSFFTYRCSQFLGFDVIANVRFLGNRDGSWGYGLKEVEGYSAFLLTIDRREPDAPGLIGSSIQLQIVDAITGQGDRHLKNYIVDEESGTVKGIDNDVCAGKKITHPDMLKRGQLYGAWGVSLPLILDTDMVEAINALSEETLEAMMRQCRFTPAEIRAGEARLQAVKAHADELKSMQNQIDRGIQISASHFGPYIISPHQWADDAVVNKLLKYPSRSYLARDGCLS